MRALINGVSLEKLTTLCVFQTIPTADASKHKHRYSSSGPFPSLHLPRGGWHSFRNPLFACGGGYNAVMTTLSSDHVRKFKATFRTLAEANLFLGLFRGRFGYLDGNRYSVSETVIAYGPAIGPSTAVLEFSPWRRAVADVDRTDFAGLLADADAREVSN
jgi:hypothetical protein